jgi:protein-L-isoaspartate(D-aspartate) O-methyltransferase
MVERQLAERGIAGRRVLDAFERVPRHLFVPESHWPEAYDDHPVHIGFGQTISQPYIVALMTEALALQGGESVLEIGTGSGYQTAILAELAAKVYTVERIPELSSGAAALLARLGYGNIEFVVGDGTLGLPAHAPYDAILVAAATPEVPKSLVSQLAVGGRLVIPVGANYGQTLRLVTRDKSGIATKDLCPCVFVRLIGREGFEDS